MISRRRFITIMACTAILPSVARAEDKGRVRWLGKALGKKSEIVLDHPDKALAEQALAEALAEIQRLEAIFSLFKPDTALSRLNREGVLAAPPADLVRVLGEAARLSELSEGAFDVTVQPLWTLYAEAIRRSGRSPAPQEVADVRKLVDWRAVRVTAERIEFARPGMAVTLNGIARGYVGDRVAELLRAKGFDHVLVDLGEPRVLGPQADGSPWPVSIRDPMTRGTALERFAIKDGAMSTTEALSLSFPGFGKYGHLITPSTGLPAIGVPSVTVLAPNATLADGLSTAIGVAGAEKADALMRAAGASRILLVSPDNTVSTLG